MEPNDPSWMHGNLSFTIETTYFLRLHQNDSRPAPILVVLHGMGLTSRHLVEQLSCLQRTPFAILVPQGVYPLEIRSTSPMRVGFSWYMYRGDDAEWLAYLQRTEEYLLRLIDSVLLRFPDRIDPEKVYLLGHSQGAYLGYFVAIRNAGRIRGLVAVGGRLKRELLEPHLPAAPGLRVLILHGVNDRSVSPDAARSSYDVLQEYGIESDIRLDPTGHGLTQQQLIAARDWLMDQTGGHRGS